MEDSACVVPKTPQESSLERGVRRPNRMSLLLAAKTNLFSGGDSDFNFVSTPNTNEKRKNIGVCESPVEVNPINLVHQISDLQKALRMVTQELDCTKKLLEVETEKRRALEKSSSPTSILDPFMNQNAECDGKTQKRGERKRLGETETHVMVSTGTYWYLTTSSVTISNGTSSKSHGQLQSL